MVKSVMNLKLRDEKYFLSEMTQERNRRRHSIKEEFGKITRKTRNILKKLRIEAEKTRNMKTRTYEKKLDLLQKKYREDEEDRLDKIPDEISDYKEAKFSVEKNLTIL